MMPPLTSWTVSWVDRQDAEASTYIKLKKEKLEGISFCVVWMSAFFHADYAERKRYGIKRNGKTDAVPDRGK